MKPAQDTEDPWNHDPGTLVDHRTLTAYERLNNAAAISRAIYTLKAVRETRVSPRTSTPTLDNTSDHAYVIFTSTAVARFRLAADLFL